MTCPNKKAIIEKAIELFHNERAKNGDPSFNIEPEISELSEGGYLSSAQSELMRNPESKNAEWKSYNENLENSSDLKFDVKEGMATTTFITGSRGIGKSDAAMKISDQLMKEGILVVVFDCSGDWIKRSGIMQIGRAHV